MNTTSPLRESRLALTLGALGVVYGDIGTSPLYTMKAVFNPAYQVPLQPDNLIGAVSVIVWGLMFVVTLKYVILILRADNGGEGGIMALTALAVAAAGTTRRRRLALLSIGVFGAALFYGDSVITPAISVLSAVEGLEVATPALQPYVVPISLGALIGLFAVQRFGTGIVGRLFGPFIALWFMTLAATGLAEIVRQPAILAALNPWHAVRFVHEQGWHFVVVLGAIVLAFTGAEALYADLGHFGKRPIRMAWLGLVMPALALNYMGQGALLMRDPAALENPFYHLFAPELLVPAVALATAATIIASQAVITGAYSMTRQAMHLGLLPRMQLRYTSAREMGQVYLPLVNWTLLAAVVMAIVAFGSSTALASAYGIAVTVTMLATTFLTFFVVRQAWKYPRPLALGATGLFLAVDLMLVAACALKFFEGGWFPLAIGIALFTIMSSWRRGRELLRDGIASRGPGLTSFLQALAPDTLPRATGRTAVYPVRSPETVPEALLHNLRHNRVLHERNVILTVVFLGEPWVPEHDRVRVRALTPRFWCVQVNYGFKDTPDIPHALDLCAAQGLQIEPCETSYFLSRETVVPTPRPGMALWREHLFALMSRNAASIAEFLRLPSSSVIELGTRVCI